MKSTYLKYILSGFFLINLIFIWSCSQKPSEGDTSDAKSVSPELLPLYPESVSEPYRDSKLPVEERIADLMSKMTLEQKAAQLVQTERKSIQPEDITTYGFGSILSGGGSTPGNNTVEDWQELLKSYQLAAYQRELKIPIIYGIDAVHGHSNVVGATIFPHNIGLGAANNPELTEAMGRITSQEVLKTSINWDFAPCVAVAMDPRWGRTYESFSTDEKIVDALGAAYTKGAMSTGLVACAKHFIGDGGTEMGTGLDGKVDRGNTLGDKAELERLLLPYKTQVNMGVQTIMPSYSLWNGTKMHAHDSLLNDVLKGQLGFEGFLISDWLAIEEIPDASFEEQVWISINAGVDMLMQPERWKESIDAIIKGVKDGKITQERLDDAVTRILKVKFDSGLFEDPLMLFNENAASGLRTEESQEVARKLAEQSMVLLQNNDGQLPLKNKKVFVVGEGADNMGLQCGGWTIEWQGKIDSVNRSTEGVTILEGLNNVAGNSGIEIITDESKAAEADVVLLVLSEIPYAEMQGDSEDLSITGSHGHPGNQAAIDLANSLNKPVVTVLLAGRHQVDLDNYLDTWSSVAIAYWPGSEGGQAIANVLVGDAPFVGKLPMPWYKSVEDIKKEQPELIYELGYGLSY